MAETKTVVQLLPDLVEWFISDREIELRFLPNAKRTGKVAPEFDFVYWLEGRRITEKCLAMLIVMELARKNYNFTIPRVLSALNELSWRNYIATCEYPDWFREEPVKVVRPPGRPRKTPAPIRFDDRAINIPASQGN